jgi:hypothetical protein
MMSGQISVRPWGILECAIWIDKHSLEEVAGARIHSPSSYAIDELNKAWQSGKVCASGEVDGQPRRVLTAEDASDFSIQIVKRHRVRLRLFANRADVEPGVLVVRSNRLYPSQLVHDRCGDPLFLYGSHQSLRHRFIKGMLFDRKTVIEKWPNFDDMSTADRIAHLVREHDLYAENGYTKADATRAIEREFNERKWAYQSPESLRRAVGRFLTGKP